MSVQLSRSIIEAIYLDPLEDYHPCQAIDKQRDVLWRRTYMRSCLICQKNRNGNYLDGRSAAASSRTRGISQLLTRILLVESRERS